MVLESIHNQLGNNTNLKTVKTNNKQRVISESTGLVKFNLSSSTDENSKVRQNVMKFSQMNDEFSTLETKFKGEKPITSPNKFVRPAKSGLNLHSSIYSPKRPSTTSPFHNSLESPKRNKTNTSSNSNSNKPTFNSIVGNVEQSEELLTQLASKQRQVLDYKTQIEILKQKSKESERELQDLKTKCGTVITPNVSPFKKPMENSTTSFESEQQNQDSIIENPFTTQIKIPSSISQIRTQIESSTALHQKNFNSLKKKLSLAQLPTSTESFNSLQRNKNKSSINLNQNFNKLQNDTKSLFNKSIKMVNNWSKEIQDKMKNDQKIYDQFNEDTSFEDSDDDEQYESYRTKTKSIMNRNKRNTRDTWDYYDENEDEDSFDHHGDISYGEADASDFMIAVK